MGEVNLAHWISVTTTLVGVMVAVFVHFEAIAYLNRWTKSRPARRPKDHHHRPTLLIVIAVLLLVHIAEIWWFGLLFLLLDSLPGLGSIVGYEAMNLWEYVYFSATTYTTVGFGDLFATGPMRFLVGTEALVGFMLITWSASFTYLVMARMWGQSVD